MAGGIGHSIIFMPVASKETGIFSILLKNLGLIGLLEDKLGYFPTRVDQVIDKGILIVLHID